MPIRVQIPTFCAVSTDNTHDKTYLQTQVTGDPSTMGLGQLFLNLPLNRIYYKDDSVAVKNSELIDQTLVNLEGIITTANPATFSNTADIVAFLLDVQTELQNYVANREA